MIRRSGGFFWIYGGHALTHVYILAFPSVMILVKREFSSSWFSVGLIVTLSSLAFGLAAVPAGFLTDRLGARRVLILGLLGSALASVAAGLTQSLDSLTVALVILGICTAFFHPAGLALATIVRPGSGRTIALIGMGGNLGMAVAPLSLAGFASLTSWRSCFFLLGGIGLLLAFLSGRGLPHPPAKPESAVPAPAKALEQDQAGEPAVPTQVRSAGAETTAYVALGLVYAVSIVMGFVYNGCIAYLPAYMTERSPGAMEGVVAGGLLASTVLLFGMVGQWWGGRLVEAGSVYRAYAITIAMVGAALVLMGLLTGWSLLFVGIMFSVLFFGTEPMGTIMVADFTPRGRRGLAFGISMILTWGVGSIASSVMGYLADRSGLGSAYVLLGLAAIPAVLASGLLAGGVGVRHLHRSSKRESEA